jgi:hypothetical protein
MAVPVRRRDTAPQPIQRWDALREREGLQEHLAQLIQCTSDGDGGVPFIPLHHITLPGDADAENIEAELRDGVLTVRIPKPQQERPRRIDVGSA